MNNRDQSAKILYGIRGVVRGQYDENIPAEYLQVPAPQLGGPGNEALRFQFVSLLRFASKVHERLLASEKELNTWKDRESSIVACLAASEPLGRALQLARDQLSDLGEETSFIDEALRHAAGPSGDTALSVGNPLSNTAASSGTSLGDLNLPAGSLLARGSAADLRIIQKDVLSQHDREPSESNGKDQCENHRLSKRKRPGVDAEPVSRHSNDVDRYPMQQQLSRRDIMPPPPKRLQHATSTILNKLASSRQQQYVDQSPSRSGHHAQIDAHNLTPRPTAYTRSNLASKDLSGDSLEGIAQAPNSFLRQGHIDDRKLEQNFVLSSVGSRRPGVSPNRLTLPSSTPSLVSRATPRRMGMLTNARTSKSTLPRTESSCTPSHRIANYRVPGNAHGPSASPYFGSRGLLASQAVASPFINRPSLSAGRQTTLDQPITKSPALAPTASTPWQPLSWLTAPFSQGQHQRQTQQQSITEVLQSGSDAYRQSCSRQHLTDQRPSINSFSFTNEPQLESMIRGDGLRNAFANHGRRAAHR
ncbi:MAG: hypothetical protein Q9216_003089 [Gyalolechia sp. 2 TL-2023]